MGRNPAHPARRPGFRRDTRGATAVEFALIAPLLCFGLLSLIEISMLAMMSSGIDNAVYDVARKIRTNTDDVPLTAADFKNQVCGEMTNEVSTCVDRLTISVQKFSSFSGGDTVLTSQPDNAYDKGSAGDIIIVKANYQWPLMTPYLATAFGSNSPTSITIASRVAFKNEPYQ